MSISLEIQPSIIVKIRRVRNVTETSEQSTEQNIEQSRVQHVTEPSEQCTEQNIEQSRVQHVTEPPEQSTEYNIEQSTEQAHESQQNRVCHIVHPKVVELPKRRRPKKPKSNAYKVNSTLVERFFWFSKNVIKTYEIYL